jgi:TonB-dependent SusC/RagA subfamily outer membrane receptor
MKKILSFIMVLMLCGVLASAQTHSVKGQVTGPDGSPLPGITIQVKGTTTATASDASGHFEVSAGDDATLIFTGVGFQEQTVKVDSRSSLEVKLATASEKLNEVVVTALGQSSRKTKIGYATTSFNSAEINKAAPVNVMNGLAGKVAGAEISSTGGPGSSTKVVLRGYGVISGGNNQPLYVIDGVPLTNSRFGSSNNNDFGNSANDVNPNDVASVTILHGTAAASLYGSAAKNGVIMITTKRGRSGKLHVDYAGALTFSEVGKLPTVQSTFGQGWGGTFVLGENGSWGPKLDGKTRAWGSIVDNSQLIKPFSPVEDNMRKFYNTGVDFDNSIALSGGNANSTFYFSYGNVSSDGVLPSNSDYL